jgi:hypothetical protein
MTKNISTVKQVKLKTLIRKKLNEHNATIQNDDDGNSSDTLKNIMKKIIYFIKTNKFSTLNENPKASLKNVSEMF